MEKLRRQINTQSTYGLVSSPLFPSVQLQVEHEFYTPANMATSKYSIIQKGEKGVAEKKDQKHGTGVYFSILLAAAVPCLFLLTMAGLLIGLTFRNRVTINPGLPELQSDVTSPSQRSNLSSFFETGGSSAYYIHFNPSSLSTLASGAGKLIPYLSSAVTGLAAFFAADSIRQMSLKEQNDKLLTPKQMSLLLGLLFSGWMGLWDSIRYRAKKGSKFNGPLLGVFATLTFTTLLG